MPVRGDLLLVSTLIGEINLSSVIGIIIIIIIIVIVTNITPKLNPMAQ
jgi:hypothetical protein